MHSPSLADTQAMDRNVDRWQCGSEQQGTIRELEVSPSEQLLALNYSILNLKVLLQLQIDQN